MLIHAKSEHDQKSSTDIQLLIFSYGDSAVLNKKPPPPGQHFVGLIQNRKRAVFFQHLELSDFLRAAADDGTIKNVSFGSAEERQ